MIETVKRPYELLVRWRGGKISGAHVGFELTTTENGKVLSTTGLPVMPVDVGNGIGFPLADILAQVHTDALIQMETANAECKVATELCAKHEAALAAAQEAVAKHEVTIAALTAANAKAARELESLKIKEGI